MILDLKKLLSGEVNRLEIDFTLSPDFAESDTASALDEVDFTSDAKVKGEIVDNGGYMRLSADVTVDYRTACARCLCDVNDTLAFSFERTVAAEGTVEQDADGLRFDLADEYVIIKNGMLDIDEQIRELILMEFPSKILCRSDCKGLCMICGKDLNTGDCGCDKHTHDPRWDVLKGITFSGDVPGNTTKQKILK